MPLQEREYDFRAMAADLMEILEAENVPEVLIWAHDWVSLPFVVVRWWSWMDCFFVGLFYSTIGEGGLHDLALGCRCGAGWKALRSDRR